MFDSTGFFLRIEYTLHILDFAWQFIHIPVFVQGFDAFKVLLIIGAAILSILSNAAFSFLHILSGTF
jgi:hypothetical protein